MDDRIKTPIKISGNIFEFLKYVKVDLPGRGAISFEPWHHLMQFFVALAFEQLLIVLKSKQIGISWSLAAQALYDIYTVPSAVVIELSKGEDEAKSLLGKSRFIYEHLPDWLQIYTPLPDSTEAFGFKEKHSQILAFPSTKDAAIGLTGYRVFHDEWDFHPFAKENFSHTKATIDAGNKLCGVSTVDKSRPDSFFKSTYKGARAGQNGFTPLFFPYDSRPGRDEVWLEEERRRAESMGMEWMVDANYPRAEEEALSPLSAQSVFDKDALNQLWETSSEPETKEGFIHIFQKPRVGVRYVAGVDVGEGVGLDHSVLSIIGRYGGQSDVAAIIYSNKIPTDIFAFEVDKLCREYRNPLLGVENNSLGVAVINKLLELNTPNVFYSDKGKKKPGWTTSSSSKQLAIVELVENINNGSLITRFKPQIQELMEYQWVDGKPEPTGSTHGDTVISLAIANQMLKRMGQPASITIFDG